MNFYEFYHAHPARWHTDKGTFHDYIKAYYNDEFTPIKNNKLNILEIGVYEGGSLNLLRQWFTNSTVIGIDITLDNITQVDPSTVIKEDAYNFLTLSNFEDNSFDYIIDDASHDIPDQLQAIKLWMPKLKKGGKLIIEDIRNIDEDKHHFDNLNIPYELLDLRRNKFRWDDVLLIFTKS